MAGATSSTFDMAGLEESEGIMTAAVLSVPVGELVKAMRAAL